MPVFDANVLLGARMAHPDFQFERAGSLIQAMDDAGIDKCLVHHNLAKMNNPVVGNEALLHEIAGDERLVPCFAVLPHYTGESSAPNDLIAGMQANDVRAVRAFPTVYNVELHLWLWKELLDVLSARRIPLFLDFNNVNWSMKWDWDGIYRLLATYPALPVVLVRVGMMANRYLYYLLEKFPQLYIETSYYQNNNGLVDIVERFGSGRLVFGSGMPQYDPRFPLSAVEHSALNDVDKSNILGGNLHRLLQEVTW